MGNQQRTGGSKASEVQSMYIPGQAVTYDADGYYEVTWFSSFPCLFCFWLAAVVPFQSTPSKASLLSKDSRGVPHMVQYYPRIDSISPGAL